MDETDDISAMLRKSAAEFVAARHDASRMRGAWHKPQQTDRTLWREMAQLGWFGLGLPEALGGSGVGLRAATELTNLFGRTLFPEPYIAACIMPTAILSACAESPAAQELASDLISGKRLLTLAWQERAGELFPADQATTLAGGKIHGCKRFVPAVENDGVLLVYVEAQDGKSIVAVSSDAEGVRYESQASGMGTFSTVHFEGAPMLYGVPLLAKDKASGSLRSALDAALIALSAQLVGVAAEALARTIRYVSDRVQFGRPIGSFQVIQHRCVDLHLGVELAGASLRHALRVHAASSDSSETSIAISAAKARCSDVALQVGRAAVQMHGAMGFAEEADVGLYLRAAMHGSAWLGTSSAHRRRLQEHCFAEALRG